MKKIYLYQGLGKNRIKTEHFAMVDDVDFENVNKYEWCLMKIYHTENKIFYARRYDNKKDEFGKIKIVAVLMHRQILGLTQKSQKCDHKDGNGLNNQRLNIRESTHAQNMSNRKSCTNGSSIYLGVFKTNSGKFQVSAKHNGVKYNGGVFVSEDVAGLKYNELATKLKGDFARLNVIRWF